LDLRAITHAQVDNSQVGLISVQLLTISLSCVVRSSSLIVSVFTKLWKL